jgi:chitodextrinase
MMKRSGMLLLVLLCTIEASAQTTIYWKKDYIRDASGAAIAVATPAPSDTTAPTTPGTPSVTGVTTTSVSLSWSSSTDGGSGVAGYIIYRGAVPIGAVSDSTTSFTDVGLLGSTTYGYRIVAFDVARNYSSYSSTSNATTATALSATASSTSQVQLSWTAGSPDHYGIWRMNGGSWSKLNTTTSATYADSTVSAATAYLYKISEEDASNQVLNWSNVDLATTVIFTDATITVASTVMKAAHVTELRTAIDAVRATAGLSSASWTNSLSGAWIYALDVAELRTNLAPARATLGLSVRPYTDSSLTGVKIKKVHIEELRQEVK